MCLGGVNKTVNILFLVIYLCLFEDAFPENPFAVRTDFPKACAYITCKKGEQCVSRKFWCKNPPCSSMLYCSKSQKESLKGPSSCETVRCSKGFICHVHARRCRWGQACEQQMARCVTARDYYEGPASCVDFRCPSDHRCILRESLCARPPCKLLRSCAETEDVAMWLEECKYLGCLSEHECFLRRPFQNCSSSPCSHTPDCSARSEEELEMREQCRGWICPKGQECSSYTKGPCKRDNCRVSRSCHKPLMTPVNATLVPQHIWRDDIKLSFYSRQENNSSDPEKPRFTLRPLTDKVSGHGVATSDIKNSMNMESKNVNPPNEGQFDRLTSSKPSPVPVNISSGPVVKPAATSLTTWLNHLKLMTGIEAIEEWMKKADKEENRQEFVEWLESVKDMLGSAAYDLWLEEVRAMTVTKKAFQKWLPPSSTNRSTDSHSDLVQTNANVSDVSQKIPGVSLNLRNSTASPNEWKISNFRSEDNGETARWNNSNFKDDGYVFPRMNETPFKQSITTRENSMPKFPTFSSTPATIGINDWSRLYYSTPRNFQQAYPPAFPQNFGNVGAWMNPALPYQGFDNTPIPNPTDPQFTPNWPFQQSPYNDLIPLGPKPWQDQFFPPAYPQWRQARDPRDHIPPDHRILDPPINPASMFPPLPEDPIKLYPQNATDPDTSWMKYFDDRYGPPQFVQSENYGSHPVADRNFVYPNWPSTNNRGPSPTNAPYGRTKYEEIEARNFPHDDRTAGDIGKRLSEFNGKSSPNYDEFPPRFDEPPRLRDDYLRLSDYDRRNLYDNNNQDGSPFFPSLSRTHRIDVDPILSPQNPYLPHNGHGNLQSEYHLRSSHPDYGLGGFPESRSTPYSIPAVGARGNEERITSPFQLTPFDPDDQVTHRPFLGDRINDIPGQTMEVPDLWNSRYRYPSDSFLRKVGKEESDDRATMKKDLPSAKNSSSVVPSTKKNITTRVLPVPEGNLRNERHDDYKNVSKNLENYSNDDGIYPLLLNLQGYIESPSRQVFQNSSNPPKNSTILPVYTIDNGPAANHYDDDYEISDEREDSNFFRNKKYGGRPDFPNNLKNVFEVEAAMIMENRTGDSDVTIKDIRWEYEDEEESNDDEFPGYWDQTKSSALSTDEASNNHRARDAIVKKIIESKDDEMETDYYDDTVAYVDEASLEEKNVFDSDRIDVYSTMNQNESPDVHNDYYYTQTEHKRFKKNRPL